MQIILANAFILMLCFIACWDIYCLGFGLPQETVTLRLGDWSRKWPILAVMIGVVLGHIFWPS